MIRKEILNNQAPTMEPFLWIRNLWMPDSLFSPAWPDLGTLRQIPADLWKTWFTGFGEELPLLLRDLNLTRDGMVEDISPLYDLPALERFWWGSMGRVPAEQKKAMRRAHPGCKFVSVYDPTDGGWRNHSHYRELHAFFRSGEYVPFSK